MKINNRKENIKGETYKSQVSKTNRGKRIAVDKEELFLQKPYQKFKT